MLTWPKNIQFYVIFFGIAHIIGYLLDGVYRQDLLRTPTTGSILQNMWFTYDWITPGSLIYIFAWILNVLEVIGFVLITLDVISKFGGTISGILGSITRALRGGL